MENDSTSISHNGVFSFYQKINPPISGKRALGWLDRYSLPENDQGLKQNSSGGSRHLQPAPLLQFTSNLAPSCNSVEPVLSTAQNCSFMFSSHGVGGKESARLTCSTQEAQRLSVPVYKAGDAPMLNCLRTNTCLHQDELPHFHTKWKIPNWTPPPRMRVGMREKKKLSGSLLIRNSGPSNIDCIICIATGSLFRPKHFPWVM